MRVCQYVSTPTTMRRVNAMLLLLALLTVSECNSRKVVGRPGENITLPCQYDIKTNGARPVCWGRGTIPTSGCNNQIISMDGKKITNSPSPRFQLQGRLQDGDVSLTILNATEKDAGQYGCRVDIYGWFNDDKYHIDLTIEKVPAPQSTISTTSDRETTTEQTTNTTGHVTSFTESIPTSSLNSVKAEQTGSSLLVVLVSVLFMLVVLVTVTAVFAKRWNRLKTPQQQTYNLVRYSQSSAIENIYQIDVDGSGDEYEYCP